MTSETPANPETLENPIWYKLPEGESDLIYGYFESYLKQSKPRSVKRLTKICNRSASWLSKLSARKEWVKRAEAYDDWKRDIELKAHEQTVEQTAEAENKLWSKRRLEIRSKEYESGKDLLDVGKQHLVRYRKLLEMPVVEQKVTRRRFSEDGKEVIEDIIIKPLVHRTGDSIKAIEIGLKLMRSAADMPTEKFEHTFGPAHTAAEDFETLTEEERVKRRNELLLEEQKLRDELERRGEET